MTRIPPTTATRASGLSGVSSVLPAGFSALAVGPHRLHPNAAAALGTPAHRELTLTLRRGVAWPRRSVAAGAPSSASTSTLSDTPDSTGDASARRTPSTEANALSSSGRRRPSSTASTRSSRESCSNTARNDGRHACCHAAADKTKAPARNPMATMTATSTGRRRAQATAAPATLVASRTYPRTNGGSEIRSPQAEPARREAAGMAAIVRTMAAIAKRETTAHHEVTKTHPAHEVF